VDFGAIRFPPSVLQIRGLICGTRDALEHSANESIESEEGERRIYMRAASTALQKSPDCPRRDESWNHRKLAGLPPSIRKG